jgi:hypothetical protein
MSPYSSKLWLAAWALVPLVGMAVTANWDFAASLLK